MRQLGLMLLAAALCTACNDDVTGESRDLDALRRATSAYKNPTAADQAGWATAITPCMTDPDSTGAMGVHYGNPDLIGDGGTLKVEQPEVLIFEPGANNSRTLVGVEYVVPYAAHSADSAPPVLFGQEFQKFDAFQLWGLHVWAWRDNPKGLYAPWNPDVSCALAPVTVAMHHG